MRGWPTNYSPVTFIAFMPLAIMKMNYRPAVMKLNDPIKSVYPSLHRAALFLAATLALTPGALSAEPSASASNPRDLFDSNRVVKIDITLAPADWDKLRNQQHDTAAEFSKDRLERPVKSPYSWFAADVTIDGTQLQMSAFASAASLAPLIPIGPVLISTSINSSKAGTSPDDFAEVA